MKPQYRFYATLLDAFAWYQQSESDNAEQEFIDKINRVPVTDEKALERMNKGTSMNNIIDTILSSGVAYTGNEFSKDVVDEISQYLHGSVAQYRTETMIRANGCDVLLYGVLDYLKENRCIDLKTTSTYDLGKYKDSMQRHLYPVSLFNEGATVEAFEFVVTDFKGVFKESYPVDLIESNAILATQCAMLIDFVESRRHLITDTKIFSA